jgi:alanine racemase
VHNKIEVSGSAILHNLGFFEAQSKTKIIPVLKGNAYGHGIEQVTQALKPVSPDYVAVDGYFEALRVQASNSKQNVLVMGMIKVSNIPKLRLRRMAFVVHDMQTIRAFGRQGRPVKIHLELNSGMNRYGISPDTLGAYLKLIKSYPKLQLEGVMSHLADSDGKSEVTVNDAVTIFDQAVKKILSDGFNPTYIHIGQSAGSLRVKSEYANASRIGIGLYGINPYPKNHQLFKICQQLKPVLTLKSTITEVHNLKKGDKVSYNYTFTAPKDMRIGVLPLGYFEGVNRELSNKGVVKVGSSFQPIVGRLCMNHTIIDISDTKAKLGDEVAVYSANPNDINSITNISYSHKLFNYGLVTALSSDVRRELIL